MAVAWIVPFVSGASYAVHISDGGLALVVVGHPSCTDSLLCGSVFVQLLRVVTCVRVVEDVCGRLHSFTGRTSPELPHLIQRSGGVVLVGDDLLKGVLRGVHVFGRSSLSFIFRSTRQWC